jgi:hypothetical protein
MNVAEASSATSSLLLESRRKNPLDGRLVAVVVLVAVLTATPVIRGKLQLLDVACLLALPFLARWVARDRRLLVLALTLAVWGIGQLVSDEVNGLGLRGSMQFATAITVLGIVPILMWVSRYDLRRACFVLAGVATGLILELLFVQHLPVASAFNWKYGFNTPVTFALLALTDLAWQRGRRIPSFLALALIVVLAVGTDHRHLAAVAALTGLLMMAPRPRHRHPRVVSTVAVLILLVGTLSAAFLQLAKDGRVGDRTAAQVATFGADPISFLVNVRPEPFQELYVYSRRPIMGWGSQPQMDTATFYSSLAFLHDIGVRRDDIEANWRELEVPGVAAHSTAFDSWLRGGLAAVPFWTLVWVLALSAGLSAIRYRSSPFVVLWTMLIVWNTFFEPMTAKYHLELAAYLVLALTTIHSSDKSRGGLSGG